MPILQVSLGNDTEKGRKTVLKMFSFQFPPLSVLSFNKYCLRTDYKRGPLLGVRDRFDDWSPGAYILSYTAQYGSHWPNGSV